MKGCLEGRFTVGFCHAYDATDSRRFAVTLCKHSATGDVRNLRYGRTNPTAASREARSPRCTRRASPAHEWVRSVVTHVDTLENDLPQRAFATESFISLLIAPGSHRRAFPSLDPGAFSAPFWLEDFRSHHVLSSIARILPAQRVLPSPDIRCDALN